MTILTQQVLDAHTTYNETEVRFHVIDPIMRKLGYSGGDDVYIKLAEKLEYPYFHIGHKSKKKDLPLGFPDYRAGLKGARGSFIVEAKAANVGISKADVEQAHSYASHAQVGANYFVLCDGRQIVIYETLSGPQCNPIVAIPIDEIDGKIHQLENILSPSSLLKNCQVSYDLGLKLCEGLGSSIKIRSGIYGMREWAYRILINEADCTDSVKAAAPKVAELDDQLTMLQRNFELTVKDGIVKRDERGAINADVSFSGVTKSNHEAMKLLGIDGMSFSTSSEFLSIDPTNPTVFETTAAFSAKTGSELPSFFGDAVPIDMDIDGDLFITARMHKRDDQIIGEYASMSDYRLDLPDNSTMKLQLDMTGPFSLELAV